MGKRPLGLYVALLDVDVREDEPGNDNNCPPVIHHT